MNLDLVAGAPEQRGAASGTEVPALVFPRRAADRDRIDREDRGGVEHRAMMLAAIKAMADADAVRRAGEGDAHRAAQAAAGKIRGHGLNTGIDPWLRDGRSEHHRQGVTPEPNTTRHEGRAFRGLVLVFLLSFVNLLGVIVTVTALGGLAPWSRWQFVGVFGVIEIASGLANVISPNIWRLPVAQLRTSEGTAVKLAASALLLPHWGGLARCVAGVVCLALTAWREGLAVSSAALVPFALAVAWSILAISAVLARIGVARPELDVVQVIVRWGKREKELAPISIGAAVFQFLLSIATIPAVKLLSPSVLYRPELGPSPGTLLLSAALSVAMLVLVMALWAGRIELRAPPEQQREAEEHA